MTAVLSGSFSTEPHVQLRGMACAQPYYPSSGSNGQLSLVSIYGRANSCSKDPLFPRLVQRRTALTPAPP